MCCFVQCRKRRWRSNQREDGTSLQHDPRFVPSVEEYEDMILKSAYYDDSDDRSRFIGLRGEDEDKEQEASFFTVEEEEIGSVATFG